MPATAIDQELAAYAREIEERQAFIDQTLSDAREKSVDLSEEQLESIRHHRDKIKRLNERSEPLMETRRISVESQERLAGIAQIIANTPQAPKDVEYRSVGEYVADRWQMGLGNQQAAKRLDTYHRAAAHQTTADNPGLIPAPILGPVISFIDSNRPLVNRLGPRQLPGQTWSRPKVTQHTSVAAQSAEKAELVSQKMTITKLTATAVTLGGYVNISRQDIDFTSPGILDIVISDLAAQYAVLTEANAFTTFDAAATAGIAIPAGSTFTAADVAKSLWDAASKIYTSSKGAGQVFAITGPDMLPILGPTFPPYGVTNAVSPGLAAADFGTGLVGSISGIPLYVSAGCGTLRILVFSTAGAEVYEDRIGSLQVVEPSVLGLQVAYAGYFTPMVVDAGSIVKIVKTP